MGYEKSIGIGNPFSKHLAVVTSAGDVPVAIYYLGSRVLVKLTPLIVRLVKFQEMMYEQWERRDNQTGQQMDLKSPQVKTFLTIR